MVRDLVGDDHRWEDANPVWIFREAAALYEGAGETKVAKRLQQIAADDAAGQGGASANDPEPTPAQRKQLQAEFAKGTHAFLRALADAIDSGRIPLSDEVAHDLRSLQKRLALEAAKPKG